MFPDNINSGVFILRVQRQRHCRASLTNKQWIRFKSYSDCVEEKTVLGNRIHSPRFLSLIEKNTYYFFRISIIKCDSNANISIEDPPLSNQTISSLSIRTERILKPNKNVLTEIIKRSIKCLKFLAVSWREDFKSYPTSWLGRWAEVSGVSGGEKLLDKGGAAQ